MPASSTFVPASEQDSPIATRLAKGYVGPVRIIGGQFRSRLLKAPRGAHTRPTTDRVKEAIFSTLASQLDFGGLRVLDLYAGTGALGLEALSRGAAFVTFVESDREALKALEHNVSTLGVGNVVRVVPSTIERAASRLTGPFDLVFADPPYEVVARNGFASVWAQLPATNGLLVLEHGSRDRAPKLPDRAVFAHREYGDTAITIYEASLGILAPSSS